MKRLLLSVSGLISGVIFFIAAPAVLQAAAQPKTCTVSINSGWNLTNMGDMYCLLLKVSDGNSQIAGYPAYLDLYAYSEGKYVHARVNSDEIENRRFTQSVEPAVLQYGAILTRKISDGQFDDMEVFFEKTAVDALVRNDSLLLDEYARYSVSEALKSLWIYNPGNAFNVSYTSSDDDSAYVISGINIALSKADMSEFYGIATFIQREIITPLRNMSRSNYANNQAPGVLTYAKGLAKGEAALDSGWNFLSYSPYFSVSTGQNGTCNITKAYVFDNDEKKWVSLVNANSSLIGSGLVVYNANGPCAIQLQGELVRRASELFNAGSTGVLPAQPPVLPN